MQKFARTAEVSTKVAGVAFCTHPVEGQVFMDHRVYRSWLCSRGLGH